MPTWARSSWAAIGGVLRSSGLPSDALNCLDNDDRNSLCHRLTQTCSIEATADHQQSEAMQAALVEWLQDWSESDETELFSLIERVREMRGAESLWERGYDWAVEGF